MKKVILTLVSGSLFFSCTPSSIQKNNNTEGWSAFVIADNKMSPTLSAIIPLIIDGDKKAWHDFTDGLNYYQGETRSVYSTACAELLVLYPGGLMALYLTGDDMALEVAQRGFNSVGVAEKFSNLKASEIRNQIIEYYKMLTLLVREKEKSRAQKFLLKMLDRQRVMRQSGCY